MKNTKSAKAQKNTKGTRGTKGTKGTRQVESRKVRCLLSLGSLVPLVLFVPFVFLGPFVFLVRFSIGFVVVVEGLVFFERWYFDGNAICRCFFQIVAAEAGQDYCDVVLTAAIVGFFD